MAGELEILLIEDNPGDARLIEEMLRDAEDLLERVDLGASTADSSRVYHEERVSDGLERLSEIEVDVILLDLDLPDSTGLDTLSTVVDETDFVPIVVLTGLRDEQLGIEAIQQGAQDYLVKDDVTSDLLVRSLHHAIERNRQERERAQRREQLEALNRLNEISQDVTHAVITTSIREELEQAVCDRLVESGAYRFAWIGEIERKSDCLTPRVAAGVEDGYLDEITISVGDGDTGQGPAGKAIRTQEVQVMQDVETGPMFEPWREEAEARGYWSSAAIPIVHQDILYGILGVYAASRNAFSEPETEILGRLGEIIGHAITAIERKDALVSDTVLELEFQIEGLFDELVALSADQQGTIEAKTIICNEDELVVYGQVERIPRVELRDAAERSETVEGLRIMNDGDPCEFELVTAAANPLVEAISTHGGRIGAAGIDGGEFRIVVEFPPGGDRRKLVELVKDHCPCATPVAQRTVDRSDWTVADPSSVLQTRLTDKQRNTLEMAYFAGYFDWPRESTGEEIADRLGVSPATFTQHLRAAERKFFDTVFERDR